MEQINYIVREPLLDSKQRVLGYELRWQKPAGHAPSEAELALLAQLISEKFGHYEEAVSARSLIFLDVSLQSGASKALQGLSPQHTVLMLPLSELAFEDTQQEVKTLRDQGFGIAVREAQAIAQDKDLLSLVSHIEIDFNAADSMAFSKTCGTLKQPGIQIIARKISNWKDLDVCALHGVNAFVGNLYQQPRQAGQAKAINPGQAMILQLMDMVRKNADVRELEAVLKRDAALSYKLLRYINSSGFGLGAEIQSLRHAVSLLGYSPLYRWLSVLLATAGTNAQSPVLMQTAIVRGRFAELLSQGLLPKSEAENLFVAGMFSLLDRLLGVPMEQVLEHIQLPELLVQALMSRTGMYGPFLALAEASEAGNDKQLASLAESLLIGPAQVNEAHLAALKWAQGLNL